MPCCKCGGRHVENRDLGLCSTCNRARRAGENPVAQKERKPIAPISAHRAAGLKPRAAAYKEVKATQDCCLACGTRQLLTPSHVLSQKHHPEHRANPFNIVVLCQTHHDLWEHKKEVFREQHPDVWALKMRIMQALKPTAYEQFKTKHP